MPYYLHDGKAAVGPFEIADLTKRPGFGATTMVCPVGATTADAWKPAAAYPDIAAVLAPAPPPPPPPPPIPSAPRAEITLTMPAPRAPEPEKPAAAPAPAPVAQPAQPAAPAGPALAAPKDKVVLVVDDDDAIRDLIEMTASSQGFQVITATDGLDAAKKLEARPVDLIVTDLMMPGQDGYAFLRSLQGGSSVPIFVVSAKQMDTSTINMIRAEANVVEFVPKPIVMPKFIAALHKHLKTAPR